jgi:leader peptidase (prepilin peptidase)/N-methyltransferase
MSAWYNLLMVFIILLYGIIIGSFCNAVVWRIHERKSISHGRSMCPECHHQLSALDLVPVLSWIGLRGKCRYCRKPISVQYPAVELITGLLFAWSYLRLMPNSVSSWAAFLIWLYLLAVLVILTVYDLRWMMLPDVVLLPAIGIMFVWSFWLGVGQHSWSNLLAGLIAGGFFYALAAVSNGRWMGGGDIKLATLMGFSLGLGKLAVAMFLGFNLGAIVSLTLIATGRKRRDSHIPFGPFLAAGMILAMLYGQQIINWYLSLSKIT